MGGLIGSVAAILVEVAMPQLRYALAVLALELGVRVALPIVADGRVLVGSVRAVVVSVALPRDVDAPSGVLALDLSLGTVVVAADLVRVVPAVVLSVAHSQR